MTLHLIQGNKHFSSRKLRKENPVVISSTRKLDLEPHVVKIGSGAEAFRFPLRE